MFISFVRGSINADNETYSYIRKMLGTTLISSERRAADQRNITTSQTRFTTDDAKCRVHESG